LKKVWTQNPNEKIVFSIECIDPLCNHLPFDENLPRNFPRYVDFRMDINIAEKLEYKYVEIPKYEDMLFRDLSLTALQEIWRRIKRVFKRH